MHSTILLICARSDELHIRIYCDISNYIKFRFNFYLERSSRVLFLELHAETSGEKKIKMFLNVLC